MVDISEIQLHDYQLAVKQRLVDNPYQAAWLDIGFGKTLTTLCALAEVSTGHILICAPPMIVKSTWADEIEKWGFNIRTVSLNVGPRGGTLPKAKRHERIKAAFTDPPTMYFMSRDLLPDLIDTLPRNEQGGIIWPFTTVVIDESQGFNNEETNRWAALAAVRPAISRLIMLSGTPAPQGLDKLWGQMYLLDFGQALGRTKKEYLNTFFDPDLIIDNQVRKWRPKPGASEEIYKRIAHLVVRVNSTNAKVSVKPDIIDIPIHLSPQLLDAYKEFARTEVLELAEEVIGSNGETIGHTISPANQAVLAGKLIQYASGTIYTDKQHNYVVLHDEKIAMCDYIINNTSGPVLIAYRFVSELNELKIKLKKMGHHVEEFTGSQKMVKRWNTGEIDVMLIHPASAGPGLNLQDGGHTLIWYDLPDSQEQYTQTNGRLARQGQTEQVFIYRLITQKTRDAKTPLKLAKHRANESHLVDAITSEIAEILPDFVGRITA